MLKLQRSSAGINVFSPVFVIPQEETLTMLPMLLAFTAAVALAQPSGVFPLKHNRARAELEQMATVLRSMADLKQVSINEATRTLTVTGTPLQIAMADWLVRQLDLPAGEPPSGVHERRTLPGSDDVARVLYLTHARTPQQVQEILTALRSVADVPRIFLYLPLTAIALRGTSQQMLLSAWLVEQLDQPGNAAAPEPREYKLPGGDVARVFELTYPETPQQLQEILTVIRSIGDIRRVFAYHARRAIALRATAEQVALAAWLVSELDQPVDGSERTAESGLHEYRLLSGPDNLVRIFYLPGSQSARQHHDAAMQVRGATRLRTPMLAIRHC
jgi:hypothetical protein